MRIFSFIIFITLILLQHTAPAQDGKEKNPRILILLDGSSSMLHEWTKDKIRFEAAAKIVDRLMDSVYSVNKNVEFALRVYGHQSPTVKNNCFDSKLEVMFSRDNYTQMMLRLAALRPLGISPIAYSIAQAAELDMKELRDNKYSLILITDGGESCEGDICKTVELMLKKKIDFKPYILSLLDYAPLRAQYSCMGEYLLVTKPEEIDPVVGKIVDAYRQSFIQPPAVAKIIETARKAPSVLKVDIPQVKIVVPDVEPEAKKPEPVVQKAPEPKKPEPVVLKTPEPEKPKPAPAQPEPVKPSKIMVDDGLARKKDEPFYLATAPHTQLPRRYFSKAPQLVKVPAIILPAIEAAPEKVKEPVMTAMATTTIAKAPVAAPKPPQPKIAEYKVVREEARETSLQVFFTNGRGKYYETAPEVVLRDIKTNEPVRKFQRSVDAYGKPRPQMDIPPGTYNLTVTGKDYVWQNIEVRANNNNKPELIVTDATLSFIYPTNPGRPVKEFNARVAPALKRAMVNIQSCTERVNYPPENYHIEVNTNPRKHMNVDVDFGTEVQVAVDEPGQIKVMNPTGYTHVEFYYQHGDQYEDFKPMNVTGSLRQQEFLIQPGRYRIAYIKDPLVPNPQPATKSFIIKSNTLTELTLD